MMLMDLIRASEEIQIVFKARDNMEKIGYIITALLFAFNISNAQDCSKNFEVDAGPSIDVCADGQVNLYGSFGGDATKVRWTGGLGKFEPNRESAEVHYFPAEGEKEVVLTLEAYNPNLPQCKPATSKVTISVHKEPHVNAGSDKQTFTGEPVKLNGSLEGDVVATSWSSGGNGTFADVHQLNTIYSPSKQDIADGKSMITLYAEPFPGCPPDSSTININFIKKN
jgi:hypothetical protein